MGAGAGPLLAPDCWLCPPPHSSCPLSRGSWGEFPMKICVAPPIPASLWPHLGKGVEGPLLSAEFPKSALAMLLRWGLGQVQLRISASVSVSVTDVMTYCTCVGTTQHEAQCLTGSPCRVTSTCPQEAGRGGWAGGRNRAGAREVEGRPPMKRCPHPGPVLRPS